MDNAILSQADFALPCNVASERIVLGCLIEDGKLLPGILASGINADDFSLSDHGRIFRAILNLHQQSAPVELVSIAEELGNREADIALIADLVYGVVIEPNHAIYHAKIVTKHAHKRALVKIGEWLQSAAAEHSANPELLISAAIGKLQEVPL